MVVGQPKMHDYNILGKRCHPYHLRSIPYLLRGQTTKVGGRSPVGAPACTRKLVAHCMTRIQPLQQPERGPPESLPGSQFLFGQLRSVRILFENSYFLPGSTIALSTIHLYDKSNARMVHEFQKIVTIIALAGTCSSSCAPAAVPLAPFRTVHEAV